MARRPKSAAAVLGLARLAASGLDARDAADLGIGFLDGPEVRALSSTFRAVPALRIPYFDVGGAPLSAWPLAPQFYRIRYLKDEQSVLGPAAAARPSRYMQPPDSGVCAYWPRTVDWGAVAAIPAEGPPRAVCVTEGEIKAACASKYGFPTIGLGGVSSYRSAVREQLFIPDLEAFPWRGRPVYVVFDSDARTNGQISAAIEGLAKELCERGAHPRLVELPDLADERKTGVDDFLVAEGPAEFQALLGASHAISLAGPLWVLNREVVYVRDPGLVVHEETGQRMAPAQFESHAYATRVFPERAVKRDGTISLKKVSAAREWLRWPIRRSVDRMTYAPGEARIMNGEVRAYNTWPGWGVEPAAGDVGPFLALVEHLFSGSEDAAREWFVSWCAAPLQRPGLKMFSSVVMHGIRQGTGKSILGYTLGRIYGRNFAEITQADLHGGFNEWAESRQFVMGDDVTGSDKRQDADLLKKLITQKELRVNVKYIPSYVVPDRVNYFFTSNHPDAFFLDDDDRRFFVHEVTVGPLPDAFYREYDRWLNGEGPAAVFAHLLGRDLGEFNPSARAHRTAARERMITDVRSDVGSWVSGLVEDPDGVLRMGEMRMTADLWTNAQLLALYDPAGRGRVTANGLGRELRRAGVPPFRGGGTVMANGRMGRYYVVRNRERWVDATVEEARRHLEESEGPGSRERGEAKY